MAELLKLSPRQRLHQVLRHIVHRGNVRQVDLRRGGAGELDLSLLGGVLETLQSHRILTEIDILSAEEVICQPVHDGVVEVVTAEVSVTIGTLHLEDPVAELEDGDIERTTA